MSGTDYIQTPNLKLYKPIYDMDDGTWGAHLNSNCDVLDAALATGSGGLFLPLAGGTLSGALTVNAVVSANSLVSSGPSGLGAITAGGGSTDHIILQPTATGTSPSITGTGPDGILITAQNSMPVGIGTSLYIAPATVLSGTTFNPLVNVQTNISGTFGAPGALAFIFANSDTANLTTSDAFPLLKVTRQFGGTGIGGGRTAGYFGLVQTTAIPSGSPDQQYNTLLAFCDFLANAGGTSMVPGSTRGSAVAFYPQTWLHPGATYYSSAVNFEADINVTPTRQQLTVSGTITASDVVTLTFTSPSDIPGSPVSVTYTVGAGNTATHVVNGLMAAINANANLQTAGVAGMQNLSTSSVLDINWQTQTNVTVAVATTGTESLVLGSVVAGASTRGRGGGSITRGDADGQQGVANDTGFGVSSLTHAPICGGFKTGYFVGGGGVWPIAWNGTIFGASEQIITNTGVVQSPWSPAKARYGFDLSLVNFTLASGASLRLPGLSVDGTGVLSLKNATLTTDTNGLTVAAAGFVGSGNPAIVNGGGGGSGILQFNYFVGDIVKDAYGGQYLVTATNTSTGAATALTTLVQPSTTGTSWGTGLATTGGSGSGLTISPTAVANGAINVGASGGRVGFQGATAIVKPTVSGAKGSNAALASLMTALAAYGLVTDSTT